VRLAAGLTGAVFLAGGGWLVVRDRNAPPRFEAAGELPAADPSSAAPAASPSAGPGADPTSTTTRTGRAAQVMVDASFAPQRLQVPDVGVDAAVTSVGVEPTGSLVIPEDPQVVGWWAGGSAPGSPVGTVLMAGHVDSARSGPGALYRLAQAPVGARVTVRGAGGAITYVVQARRRYLKGDLPWKALFAQGMQPRLVLITCGGAFDSRTRHYTDNVVVVATPARS
jgi:hypothetical protein